MRPSTRPGPDSSATLRGLSRRAVTWAWRARLSRASRVTSMYSEEAAPCLSVRSTPRPHPRAAQADRPLCPIRRLMVRRGRRARAGQRTRGAQSILGPRSPVSMHLRHGVLLPARPQHEAFAGRCVWQARCDRQPIQICARQTAERQPGSPRWYRRARPSPSQRQRSKGRYVARKCPEDTVSRLGIDGNVSTFGKQLSHESNYGR